MWRIPSNKEPTFRIKNPLSHGLRNVSINSFYLNDLLGNHLGKNKRITYLWRHFFSWSFNVWIGYCSLHPSHLQSCSISLITVAANKHVAPVILVLLIEISVKIIAARTIFIAEYKPLSGQSAHSCHTKY